MDADVIFAKSYSYKISSYINKPGTRYGNSSGRAFLYFGSIPRTAPALMNESAGKHIDHNSAFAEAVLQSVCLVAAFADAKAPRCQFGVVFS
jgi:hypothetical protein